MSQQENMERELYRILFDQSPDSILLIEKDGKLIAFNNAALSQLGYSKEELGELSIFDLDPVDNPGEIRAKMETALKDGKTEFGARLKTKVGGIRDANVIVQALDLAGRTLFHISLRDITESKQAWEALRASEYMFKSIFANANDGIIVANIKTKKFTLANNTIAEMLGYTPDELKNLGVVDIHPEKDLPYALAHFESQTRQEIGLAKNIPVKRKDGSIFYADINTSRLALSGEEYMAGFFRDSTERRKAETLMQARIDISDYAYKHSLDELLQYIIDETERLTNSNIGFYHFVDDNQQALHLQMWSSNTIKNMCTAKGNKVHYSISDAGVWCECFYSKEPVIHNDYAGLTNRKGYPEGHAAVIRELVVPVIRENKVKAILGVGNKAFDYDQSDVKVVSEMANIGWDICEWKRTEASLQEQRIRNISADRLLILTRLKMLQAQIEPHFLFNTIANIVSLIDKEPETAKNVLLHLTESLRVLLERARDEQSTLAQEVGMLRHYLSIYSIRMGPRLHFEIDIPEDLSDVPFPPMLVQPLVENAVLHGIEPKIEGGDIKIKAERTDGLLRVSVTDTGIGFFTRGAGSGFGLANVMARIHAIYGNEACLMLEENKPCGTIATIKVPI